MYRFESSIEPKVLEKRYKDIYANAKLQEKWDYEVIGCPDLALTIPDGVKPTDLLIMKYEKLVEVYLKYRGVYDGLDDDNKKLALNTAAGNVFSYGSYNRHIKKFLMNPDNGFEIHNCVYCDLVDARTIDNDGGKRQFDTEHILDKGECPLVGLSLYNFCPACGICNTNYKGTNPIGTDERQMKKLSPTSKQYDFKHKVKFIITDHPDAVGSIKFDHLDWYDIDFDYKDDDYREVTKLFDLKKRYNLPQNKLQALEWREKAMKNRGIAMRLLVMLHIKTEEQVREEIFHLNAHRQVHSPMLKLMEDIIGIQ